MNPTVTRSRYCCSSCGGHHVETLDWVALNGDELIGGDVGEDYWCPDCDTHPSGVEARDVVFVLCDACAGHRWGTNVPLPGVLVTATGAVERCEVCEIYTSAVEAAHAVSSEIARRGGSARVSIVVDGIRSTGWDETTIPSAPG